jgi:hypothetical protein
MAEKDPTTDLFIVPWRHLPGILRKITGTWDTWRPALNFNRTRPEYKSYATLLANLLCYSRRAVAVFLLTSPPEPEYRCCEDVYHANIDSTLWTVVCVYIWVRTSQNELYTSIRKTCRWMLYTHIIAVYSKNHTRIHIFTVQTKYRVCIQCV